MRSRPSKKIINHDRVKLLELRRLLTFESASFGHIVLGRDVLCAPRDVKVAKMLLQMSRTQRTKLYKRGGAA